MTKSRSFLLHLTQRLVNKATLPDIRLIDHLMRWAIHVLYLLMIPLMLIGVVILMLNQHLHMILHHLVALMEAVVEVAVLVAHGVIHHLIVETVEEMEAVMGEEGETNV